MRIGMLKLGVLFAACVPIAGIAGDGTLSGLRHNPFDKPRLLAEPVTKPPPAIAEPTQPPPLKGTLVSADIPMAIVDGELLRVGETHAGYRLVSVQEGAAVFEHEGKEIKVVISDSSGRAEKL